MADDAGSDKKSDRSIAQRQRTGVFARIPVIHDFFGTLHVTNDRKTKEFQA
jgi:hypothetical protein